MSASQLLRLWFAAGFGTALFLIGLGVAVAGFYMAMGAVLQLLRAVLP